MKLHNNRQRLFYLIKFARFSIATKSYSKQKVMLWVKQKQMEYIHDIIDNDPIKANDNLNDITKNDYIMFISFTVKLIELVSMIFTSSYFFLIIWILLCEGIEDFIDGDKKDSEQFDNEHFFPTYGLNDEKISKVTLKIFYYAFTSLTTVGFGDFHPISELE
jgi:hypothetical protein